MLTRAFEQAGLAGRILKPSDWNPGENGWPTISWMNEKGKQIIVFSSKPATKYIYQRGKYVVSNPFGTLDRKKTAEIYPSKDKRYLYLFNFFKDPAEEFSHIKDPASFFKTAGKFLGGLNFSQINGSMLESAIYYAIRKGPMAINNRYPNFVVVDFIEKGSVFAIVDNFNKQAHGRQSKVFRPIIGK